MVFFIEGIKRSDAFLIAIRQKKRDSMRKMKEVRYMLEKEMNQFEQVSKHLYLDDQQWLPRMLKTLLRYYIMLSKVSENVEGGSAPRARKVSIQ